jgi:hypothetical protein
LTLTQHRILGDQLAMAYGISGHTADSKALLRELARTDPGYPLGNPWVIQDRVIHRVIQDGTVVQDRRK